MNNVAKIAQIGSELLAHFGDTEHAKIVALGLEFLSKALYYKAGTRSMLDMRDLILGNQNVPALHNAEWTRGHLFWSWIVDPICAVHMRRVLGVKEPEPNPQTLPLRNDRYWCSWRG